tara:strand:- start:59 stop:991 length:933 start_codon:yes stop_codon:yes gene_type:complete
MDYIKEKLDDAVSYDTKQYLNSSKEFVESNSAIAKTTFLLFVILIFIFIFIIASKIILFLFQPSNSPYILDSLISSGETRTVSQDLGNPKSVPILRSINEYDGIEFTYSIWMNVEEPTRNNIDYSHIFNKGTTDLSTNGLIKTNNSPGLYLYSGKYKSSNDRTYNIDSTINQMGVLIILNVFFDNTRVSDTSTKHEERIYVDGIPIKKWVNITIRVNQQNIVDIYINGILTKRHRLNYPVRQNYDSLNINYGNNYLGDITTFRYFNYAIGTFEIDQIISDGPSLKTSRESNLAKSFPRYLSNSWYYSSIE